jgi:signal transduction histidine kinase
MADYKQGTKKDVAEIKFLIHDLRVEKFINEVIHFHVTLNTDLEIYNVDQAQILHGHDLEALKAKAVSLRRAFQTYSNGVKSFSPDRTVILLGKKYIDTIYSTCELILNPMWGRIDKVLAFLPSDSRSVQSRAHYLNCIHWIRGVQRRIGHFQEEQRDPDLYEEFDIAAEIEHFTRDVIYGYVAELSRGRVQIELDRLDSAILGGNLPRFRRMYFNLVMNAVDAMSNREVGVLNIGAAVEGERVVLRVLDNGSGMTKEKISELLTDKETLDGELHSLGFVFVRQTIEEFRGELSIESEEARGTTVTVRLPYRPGKTTPRLTVPSDERDDSLPKVDVVPRREEDASVAGEERSVVVGPPLTAEPPRRRPEPTEPLDADEDRNNSCGRMVYRDYEVSDAQFPGSILGIAVTNDW